MAATGFTAFTVSRSSVGNMHRAKSLAASECVHRDFQRESNQKAAIQVKPVLGIGCPASTILSLQRQLT